MAVAVVAARRFGRLAQLVRALPSHGRGQRFKSFVAHHAFLFSHCRSGPRRYRASFVLNLLFSGRWKRGLQPFQNSHLQGDAVVGIGGALYSARLMKLLRTLEFMV